jgi:hypothetical protein
VRASFDVSFFSFKKRTRKGIFLRLLPLLGPAVLILLLILRSVHLRLLEYHQCQDRPFNKLRKLSQTGIR